jgi:hypothetical protein
MDVLIVQIIGNTRILLEVQLARLVRLDQQPILLLPVVQCAVLENIPSNIDVMIVQMAITLTRMEVCIARHVQLEDIQAAQ